jgi:methylenetetrahydrofolate dehydrogenase (NADP+)/methenyltetrahydrofolate cyclohydrolase
MSVSSGAKVIDGRLISETVKELLVKRVRALRERGFGARLDAILVGGDSAANLYAKNQASTCNTLGIDYVLHQLPDTAGYDEVAGRVLLLNTDENVSAVMVHLPLPSRVDTERVQSLIAPEKDVEGVNPVNIGNVVYGRRSLLPCTALAALEMIESTGISLRGKLCVCVGASTIVGKPIAVLLMQAEATVVSANVYTEDLPVLTRMADVVVAAAGVPGLVTAAMIKPGAVVIDVGINRVRGDDGTMRTVGDVADDVFDVAGWCSPVPGGVGPMTVAMLLRNTVDAAERGGRRPA